MYVICICRFSEDQLERSVRGLSTSWHNLKPPITNTLKSSTEKPSISSKCADNLNSFVRSAQSIPSTSISENLDYSDNTAMSSDQASDISDYSRNLFPNQLNMSHCASEKVTVEKLSTLIPSSPNIPTKCFSGDTQQRKKRNKPDILETSFVSAANVFKEYILEKKKKKRIIYLRMNTSLSSSYHDFRSCRKKVEMKNAKK